MRVRHINETQKHTLKLHLSVAKNVKITAPAKDEQRMTRTRHGLKGAGLQTLFLAQTIDADCFIWTLGVNRTKKPTAKHCWTLSY